MALSNIFVEPRREITETIVGVVFVGLVGWGDWYINFRLVTDPTTHTSDRVVGLIFAPIGLIVLVLALVLAALAVHGIGDLLCGLAKSLTGLDPRPKRRYQRIAGKIYTRDEFGCLVEVAS